MPEIHPSAIVSERARLAEDVTVGPFSIIDAGVEIGPGSVIGAHAWITGSSKLGKNNTVGYGTIIGADPQDTSFKVETASNVEIGDDNVIREYVTIHRSAAEGGSTSVGHSNFLMTGVHLAHDVQMGSHNVLANNVLIAGHVKLLGMLRWPSMCFLVAAVPSISSSILANMQLFRVTPLSAVMCLPIAWRMGATNSPV
jgi:UDP-N-acetylglucosamine acyltransferase